MSQTKRTAKHIQHYLPLLGILAAGVLGILSFPYDRGFQAAIAVGVAAGYVVWGIVHHHLHRDLHLSVVFEYIIIAALGLVVVFSLLFTA